MCTSKNLEVPIWEKEFLTILEASHYFNIGINKLREMTEEDDCKFVIYVGRKRLIKKKIFAQYLEKAFSV